ncbi:MFS general substrate transporter, partial [Russula dissimulans]
MSVSVNPESFQLRAPDMSGKFMPSTDIEEEKLPPTDENLLRRATLKMDLCVVPILALLYFLSFLDKANIGNARVAGLTESLRMSNYQFSIALTVTYVPYICMELPMNLLLKHVGANVTFPFMVILWGIACACQGAVNSYHGLLVCRFFLGAFEGGLLAGIMLLFSIFYKRHDLQLRISMMHSVSSLAGAFSGLLAFAIQHLNGKYGLAGWQWIFILEGCFSVIVGVTAFRLIPSSPKNVILLTEEEKKVYCQDLADDWSGDADADGVYTEVFSWNEVASVFTDRFHCLLFLLPSFFNGTLLFGLANFTPTIVSALGHSRDQTQLLTIPPFACSFVYSITSAYFCDKYKNRSVMSMFSAVLAAAGYAMFLCSANKTIDYCALYLQIIGAYGVTPSGATWNANNVQPHYRRATAIAASRAMANVGGIVSTWLFTDPPRFRKAASINLTFSLGMAASCVILRLYLSSLNEKGRREVQHLLETQGKGTAHGGWDSP